MILAVLCHVNATPTSTDRAACKTGPANDYSQTMFEGRCCDSCSSGTHMVNLCNVNDPASTVCKVCDPHTYTAHPNLLAYCLQHHRCRANQLTDREGTLTNDFKCSCQQGYTKSPEGGCIRQRHESHTTRFVHPTRTSLRYGKTTGLIHDAITSQEPYAHVNIVSHKDKGIGTFKPVSLTDEESKALVDNDDDGGEEISPVGPLGGGEHRADGGSDGLTLEGKHIVIITVVMIFCITVVVIVAIVRIKRSPNHNEGERGQYNCPYHYGNGSDNIDTTVNDPFLNNGPRSSVNTSTSCMSTVSDLIKLDADSQEDLLNKGSTTAVALEESQKPSSRTSLQDLKDSRALGLKETGKPKSVTSINNLGSAIHSGDHRTAATTTSASP
ncbi:uncharacterized protein LOC144451332 isoform X2 [Glandiceps talaboti]